MLVFRFLGKRRKKKGSFRRTLREGFPLGASPRPCIHLHGDHKGPFPRDLRNPIVILRRTFFEAADGYAAAGFRIQTFALFLRAQESRIWIKSSTLVCPDLCSVECAFQGQRPGSHLLSIALCVRSAGTSSSAEWYGSRLGTLVPWCVNSCLWAQEGGGK